MSVKCIAVYCGAREGQDPALMEGAKALGDALLKHKIDLIYGAGCRGMMGAISRKVSEGGGKVTGVIPKFFQDHDFLNPQQGGVGEVIVKEDMHSRKKFMAEKADAFIALPGGFGTMEELLEIITWVQLGLHDKPIGVLNTNNYYKGFLDWLATAVEQGFISPEARQILTVSSDPEALVEQLKEIKEHRKNNPVWSYINR